MSGFCPEGFGTCKDAEAGPCVVGHPCELHPVEQKAEKDEPCACRWSRDAAGRQEFRECTDHYVARVFPAVSEDGE